MSSNYDSSSASSLAAQIQSTVDAQRAAQDPLIKAMLAQTLTEVAIVIALGRLDGKTITEYDARASISRERQRIAECVRLGYLKLPEVKQQ